MSEKKYEYTAPEYTESDAVKQAKALLEQQNAAKPGAYQSQWQSQLKDATNNYLNRGPFQYDLNGDALYQQYKDRFIKQGQMAMQDTMGQAAMLTGGYGNSYAQTAGQQAYQQHLQGLNDKVPELYQLALSKYQSEGQDMLDKVSLLTQQEAMDRESYEAAYNKWLAERDHLTGRYDAERDYDYGKFTDERNFSYQQEQDRIAREQWEREFAESQRQFDLNYGLRYGSGGGETTEQDVIDPDIVNNPPVIEGSMPMSYSDLNYFLNLWKAAGYSDKELSGLIRQRVADGSITQNQAQALLKAYTGGTGDGWADGISETRNVGGVKASAWDSTKQNLKTLLRSGNFTSAEKYMDQIIGELNQSQYNEAMSILQEYGYFSR